MAILLFHLSGDRDEAGQHDERRADEGEDAADDNQRLDGSDDGGGCHGGAENDAGGESGFPRRQTGVVGKGEEGGAGGTDTISDRRD